MQLIGGRFSRLMIGSNGIALDDGSSIATLLFAPNAAPNVVRGENFSAQRNGLGQLLAVISFHGLRSWCRPGYPYGFCLVWCPVAFLLPYHKTRNSILYKIQFPIGRKTALRPWPSPWEGGKSILERLATVRRENSGLGGGREKELPPSF